tara:strand:+ start:15 stop:521 length:507 start_codon:yes stop_codon:yes gene_type:complete
MTIKNLYKECIKEINEIGEGKNDICKKYFYKVARRNDNLHINDEMNWCKYSTLSLPEKPKHPNHTNTSCSVYGNVFGFLDRYKTTTMNNYHINGGVPIRESSAASPWGYWKEGIEILGCKASEITCGGSEKFRHRHNIKELKDICKMNGLKGYSKLKKQGLYALLMTI